MQSIQTKLIENDAMIMSADKGNSLVILPTQQYNKKVQAFTNNNFQTSITNPTKTFRNQIRKTTNCSTTLIPQDSKWKFISLMETFLGIVTGVLEPTGGNPDNQGTAREEPGSDNHYGRPPSLI